jgi:hypothetical protein
LKVLNAPFKETHAAFKETHAAFKETGRQVVIRIASFIRAGG